jgi:hypothetical protein
MPGQSGWNKWKWVLFFLLPSAAGLTLFVVYPVMASLWYSFNEWNLLSPPSFVGLANYRELFADDDFLKALGYTVGMIALYLPAAFGLGLALALFLNQKLRGMLLVRTVTFMSVVASWVVVSIIWKWLFNPAYGLINYGLGLVGVQGPAWLFGVVPTARFFTNLRHNLLPYIWQEAQYAAATGEPMMRSLQILEPAAGRYDYLFGRDLLVAPVVEPDTDHLDVYLPAGRWQDWWTGIAYDGQQQIQVAAPIEQIPLFVRNGAQIPLYLGPSGRLGDPLENGGDLQLEPNHTRSFVG